MAIACVAHHVCTEGEDVAVSGLYRYRKGQGASGYRRQITVDVVGYRSDGDRIGGDAGIGNIDCIENPAAWFGN